MTGRLQPAREIGRLCLVAALLVLAACGNTPDRSQGFNALRAAYEDHKARVASTLPGTDPAAVGQEEQQIAVRAMKSVPGPVLMALVADTKRTAVLGVLQTNGPYVTWRTASRQTLTLKNGVLTGTRGLGFDLMSSDADAAIALIRARRPGTVNRIYRHINGDNQEVPTTMACTIAPSGAEGVTLATGASFGATKVKETCRAEGLKVTNTYWVTASGDIPQSIQWVSPQVGKLVLQSLRN